MPDEYEELFDVPVAAPLWLPAPWFTATGPVRWLKQGRGLCEDCEHCIIDDLAGRRPSGAGFAGPARRATVRRVQGLTAQELCAEHARLRKEAEDA